LNANGDSWGQVLANPSISAVICTHNRYEFLTGSIASLLAQDTGREDLEIIVVDNSTDPKSARKFGDEYAALDNFHYVYEPTPGLSNARNVGARLASAPIIAYIDDDAIASPQWARAILAAYDKFGKDAAVVGGPVRPIWLKPRPEWFKQEFEGFFSIVDRGNECRELLPEEWLAGCNISFRREILLSVGGFSINLGRGGALSLLSNEETRILDVIRANGKKIIYAPGAVADHYVDATRTSPDWLKRRIAWQAVSDVLSKPEMSAEAADLVSNRFNLLSRLGRAFYFSNIINRKKRVDSIDRDRIYNTILVLLCRGS
jgi:glucosyl-dolichyl phosphate glucuronosyltransferase